tara:strand:+ start:987 stop:1145 length:159 start_codon:yes stop_codon:yes gene_type:complete
MHKRYDWKISTPLEKNLNDIENSQWHWKKISTGLRILNGIGKIKTGFCQTFF